MPRTAFTLVGIGLVSVSLAAQGPGAAQAPPTDTVAPAIPGVVAAGTPVHVIKDGFNGSEGPIALPDGSVLFSETNANRTIKIDPGGTVSVRTRERFDSCQEWRDLLHGFGQPRPGSHYERG